MTIKWTLHPRGLRHIADVCPSHKSQISKTKIVYFEVVYKIHHTKTSLRFCTIFFIISYNKAAEFGFFKKKSHFVEESVDLLPDLPIKNFQVGLSKGHLIYVLEVYVICGVFQGRVRVFEID